jgi:hypothetical protein
VQPRRPNSPLRNSFSHESDDDEDDEHRHGDQSMSGDEGEDDEDADEDALWRRRRRSHSPASSSVSQLAVNFAQRVAGSLMPPQSPHMRSSGRLTDAEIEAEAERERDRSRREAERILTREAEQRRLVEDRVLELLQSQQATPNPTTHMNGRPMSMPPPNRAQTVPVSSSPKDEKGPSWWATAKQRLTPTKDKDKESLTPAQQIIQDAKLKDKAERKYINDVAKHNSHHYHHHHQNASQEWPAAPERKYSDPAMLNLAPPPTTPPRRPVPSSSSPTLSQAPSQALPPSLAPSPHRSTVSSSPSAEPAAPPLYAQFNAQGVLDVPGTLLVLARRFEKLEKWSVAHVRALEERMSDVERWLVDKEAEREQARHNNTNNDSSNAGGDTNESLAEIREELAEVQGRMGELGRQMAKLVTSPNNLASAPARAVVTMPAAPEAPKSSFAPPVSTSSSSSTSSASSNNFFSSNAHLASPPSSSTVALHSTARSTLTPPLTSPPSSSMREATSPPLQRQQSYSSGSRLPYPSGDYASPKLGEEPTISGLPNRSMSPTSLSGVPTASDNDSVLSPPLQLQPPRAPSSPSNSTTGRRNSPSPSPTPRKRYTVALGAPVTSRPSSTSPSGLGTALYSSASEASEDDEDDDFKDDTIGKKSSARIRPKSMYSSVNPPSPSPAPAQSLTNRTSTASLKIRPRSQSSAVASMAPSSSREEDKKVSNNNAIKAAAGKPRLPVGALVAFFDGERRN